MIIIEPAGLSLLFVVGTAGAIDVLRGNGVQSTATAGGKQQIPRERTVRHLAGEPDRTPVPVRVPIDAVVELALTYGEFLTGSGTANE